MNRKQYQSQTRDLAPAQHVELGLNSPSQPLDAQTRAVLEPRFNHDFSQVRVHSDSNAARSAEHLDSRAYAVGQDIVMNSGEYAPGTVNGLGLLAHELTHTIQQGQTQAGQARVGTDLKLSHPGDASEAEAGHAARNLMRGTGTIGVSSGGSEPATVSRMISGAFDDLEMPSWGDVTGAVGGAVAGGAGAIGGGIGAFGNTVGNLIGGAGNLVGGGISTAGSMMGEAARFGGGLFGETGAQIGGVAGGAIDQIGGLLGGSVGGGIGNFGNRVSNGYNNLGAGLAGMGGTAGGYIAGMEQPSLPELPPFDPRLLLM